jgi:polysaccharide export outer membrane protein
VRRLVVLALLLTCRAWTAKAQPVETSAEIRIGLPAGQSARVGLRPGPDRVVLDLPAGAVFPADFRASSGALVREARVAEERGRVALELELALGILDEVRFEPGALVVRLRSSIAPVVDAGDPEERYLLGPDDRISLSVHGHPEAGAQLTVSREGAITAPLVGEVHAAGLTPRQLAARLAELLGRSYLVDPQVDVRVEEYRSQWVVVSGEVRRPGRIALHGGTRLKEILGQAEGFTERAGEWITITRRLPDSDETKSLRVARGEFESGRSNPPLTSGDVIEVAPAAFCYIQGEVNRPNRYQVERGLTLLRAVTLAGGLTDWADRKSVRVLYPAGSRPRERSVNLNDVERGRVEDPEIVGGEVIIVKKRFL